MDAQRLDALKQELKVTRWPSLVQDIQDIIAEKRQRCIAQLESLERYISEIPDAYIRQIFTLRYVEGLPWAEISLRLGGVNSPENLRVTTRRYLKRDAF